MKNVIIFFDRPDASTVAVLQQSLQDAEVWTFDPYLLDDLHVANIKNCKYINLRKNLDFTTLSRNFRNAALDIEGKISTLLKAAAVGFNIENWQYLGWYCLQAKFQAFPDIWNELLSRDFGDYEFHIPVCDKPAKFDHPSFLPALSLMERMSARGVKFKAYIHSTELAAHNLIPTNQANCKNSNQKIFIHIPTCMYDVTYFNREFISLEKSLLAFDAPLWNTKLADVDSIGLSVADDVFNELDADVKNAIEESVSAILNLLIDYFRGYFVTSGYVLRQAESTSQAYRSQLIFLHSMYDKYHSSPPEHVVISSHDTGIHGPFLSFAERLGVPVTVLPHSKVFTDAFPSSYKNTRVLAHPIQSVPIYSYNNTPVKYDFLNFPNDLSCKHLNPKKLLTLGVLLNKFAWGGISLIDTDNYIEGLRRIMDWCRSNGVIPRYRLKPYNTCVIWLCTELGISLDECLSDTRISLVDFANKIDLCLMYDSPTTASIEILNLAVPIISILPRCLSAEEASIGCIEVIPSYSVSSAIDVLDELHADQPGLSKLRGQQFARYADKRSSALGLRSYL